MNDYSEPASPFERRRTNRALLMVVAMALAGIALNDGVHAFMASDAATIVARAQVLTTSIGAESAQCLPDTLPRR